MPRPATDADFTEASEDFYEYVKQASLTANTPTDVLAKKIDVNEMLTLETFGTNGGADITLKLRNKNDVIGEEINGINTPLVNREDWYPLSVVMTFVPGDHVKLTATSAAGATNIKFFWKGHQIP